MKLELGSLVDGRYRVGTLLGRGYGSLVFEAVDEELSRTVAIKVLEHRSDVSEVEAERFAREALVGAELNHPHIVRVHAHGPTGDGGLYFVMERLVGQNLAEELRARPSWRPRELFPLFEQLAAALGAAHAAGVVHRDVKPANVFLTEGGDAKLLDFGIALRAGDVRLTNPGEIIGTPHNLAPEQVRLAPSDHRVDVYGLGVLAYRLLSGRMPFAGSPRQVLVDIVRKVPRPPSVVLGRGSHLLDAIVMRAIEKDMERRFPSVGDFVIALRMAVDTAALSIPPDDS